ncbi:MAG: DUF2303 family protein [Pseudomonadota bacterium]
MDTTTPVAPGFDARFIADLGAKASQAQDVNINLESLKDAGLPTQIPAIWDPKNAALISVQAEAEKYRLAPKARRGTAKALTLESFIALVNRHATDQSVVFADTTWTKPSFTAVIDYHPVMPGEGASFGKHRVLYDFPLSEEWKKWVEMDGEPMSQFDFAAFLEDRISDLSSPLDAEKAELERDFATTVANPAELILLSRKLHVTVESKVTNALTLQSGAGQIQWEEEHKGADGKPITVPGLFILNIAPFFMGEKARIPVRLRYRAKTTITWSFHIYRPDVHVTERVRGDLDIVAKKTSKPTFEGAPEMTA